MGQIFMLAFPPIFFLEHRLGLPFPKEYFFPVLYFQEVVRIFVPLRMDMF